MRIPDTTKSLDAQDLSIITHLSEIVRQSSDTCKILAINIQCSLQGNDMDTQRNSVLEEVEQEMFWMS